MLGDVVGYCTIKNSATTGRGKTLDKFIGKDVRVLEFNDEGDVLVLSSDATEMAMFDACDVKRKFRCSVVHNIYICPPDLDMIGQMAYASKIMMRKAGYNTLLMNMVIQGSLMKGEFNDQLLWAFEKEQAQKKETVK